VLFRSIATTARRTSEKLTRSASRIGALQRRLVVAERVSFSLVLLSVVAMASARYL